MWDHRSTVPWTEISDFELKLILENQLLVYLAAIKFGIKGYKNLFGTLYFSDCVSGRISASKIPLKNCLSLLK